VTLATNSGANLVHLRLVDVQSDRDFTVGAPTKSHLLHRGPLAAREAVVPANHRDGGLGKVDGAREGRRKNRPRPSQSRQMDWGPDYSGLGRERIAPN